jgi:hypothetical protein
MLMPLSIDIRGKSLNYTKQNHGLKINFLNRGFFISIYTKNLQNKNHMFVSLHHYQL